MTHSPLSPARDEENRRLAAFVGYRVELRPMTIGDRYVLIAPDGDRATDYCYQSAGEAWDERPDFFSDEAANALLRRRMREEISYMVIHREGGDEVVRFVPKTGQIISGRGTTDLEAIVKAALAYLEAQK
jgi:hypothetical protein